MTRSAKRSGLLLVLAGVAGILLFWLTDPRYGWHRIWNTTDNVIDAANRAYVGTLVGMLGSVVVLVVGLWLLVRRSA